MGGGGAEGWIIQLGLDLVSKCLAIIMEIETSSDFWYLSISDGGRLGIIPTPLYIREPIRWCIQYNLGIWTGRRSKRPNLLKPSLESSRDIKFTLYPCYFISLLLYIPAAFNDSNAVINAVGILKVSTGKSWFSACFWKVYNVTKSDIKTPTGSLQVCSLLDRTSYVPVNLK